MAVAVALLGANVTLDAVRGQYAFWTNGLMITAYVGGLLAIVCFAGAMRQRSVPLAGDWAHRGPMVESEDCVSIDEAAAIEPGPMITDRWRHTSDGGQVPVLIGLTHATVSHPGYGGRQPQDAPPSVKVDVLVACQPIDPAGSGTEIGLATSDDPPAQLGVWLLRPAAGLEITHTLHGERTGGA